MPKQVPKKVGVAEGGGRLPKLHELLDALAEDMAAIYAEVAGLDATDRNLIGSAETNLEVEETAPAEGAEDVAVDADIVVTFDRNIAFTDDEAAAKTNIEVDADGSQAIDSISLSDKVMTIDLTASLPTDQEVTVTIPHDEDTVMGEDDGRELEETFELKFTTVE